jgi:hypothetical protein
MAQTWSNIRMTNHSKSTVCWQTFPTSMRFRHLNCMQVLNTLNFTVSIYMIKKNLESQSIVVLQVWTLFILMYELTSRRMEKVITCSKLLYFNKRTAMLTSVYNCYHSRLGCCPWILSQGTHTHVHMQTHVGIRGKMNKLIRSDSSKV